jgi:hypothetical protein
MAQPRSLRAARMPSLFIVESELLLPLEVAASLLLLVLGDVAVVLSGAVVLGVDCGVRVLCDGVVVELGLSVVDCAYT